MRMAVSPFAPFFLGGFFVAALIGIAMFSFEIWMIIDAARRPEADFNPPNSRVWWLIGLSIGIFLNLIGLGIAIAYYVIVKRPAQQGGASPIANAPIVRRSGTRACRNCGEPLGTHARFCNHCGTPSELEE